jgi:hypothetical protein
MAKALEEELALHSGLEFTRKYVDFPYVYDFRIKFDGSPKEMYIMVTKNKISH